jgi:hypothetical protein
MHEKIKDFLELVHNLYTALYIYIYIYIYNKHTHTHTHTHTHIRAHLTTAALPLVENLWKSEL